PADFATAHGVGLAGERERPDAGATDAASGEMTIDDGVDFVGTLRRLIDALRVTGDDPVAGAKKLEKTRNIRRCQAGCTSGRGDIGRDAGRPRECMFEAAR